MPRYFCRPQMEEDVFVCIPTVSQWDTPWTEKNISNGAFIRTGDYRISQLTTREERSFGAEVQVIMGNIP